MGIIPVKERQKFIDRERHDYRRFKQLTEKQLEQRVNQLPVQPPIFYKLTHPQKVGFIIGATTYRFCFFMDTGCLDGNTLLETDKGPIAIAALEKCGKPIQVLSRTVAGLRFVSATAPFKRGPTALFEVFFASGRKMVVTAKHRFLTERGFVPCEFLLIGERLPRFDAFHQRTIQEPSLDELSLDASHLKKIIQGSKDRYCQYYHPYGEQPHQGLNTSPNQIQQFCETVEQNRLYEQMDDSDIGLPNNHHDPYVSTLAHHELFSSNHSSNSISEFCLELSAHSLHKISINKAADILHEQGHQDPATGLEFDQTRPHHSYNPLAFSSSHDCIKDIKYLKTDCYYDLHVPIHENYIAEGFCHHNTGKSLLTIALIRYFRRLGLISRTLILVPNRTNKTEWKDELQKHSPNSSCLVLPSAIEEKWRAIEQGKELFVIETYAGLYRMVTSKKKDKQEKNYLGLDDKKVKRLQSHFQGFACDESENVGNHMGLPFRVCRQLAKTSKVVFTLTGTPFNRDPSLLWAQMYLVDGGYTLGETLGLFRSVFCSETDNYWSGAKEYKFLKKNEALLNDFIANRSIEYAADAASLPECVLVKKYVTLDADAMAYYERFKQQLIAAQGNFTETKNAFMRLRQISSGFIGYEDDETGEKAKFEFPENAKLELLLSILKATRSEYKVIVFFEFTYSGEKILETLKKAKIGATIIYGKTKDTDVAKKQFLENAKTRVLLLQNRMAPGMNVQVARYGIFYESPVSAIKRKQCRRRVERQHALHKTVFIYDLLLKGGVDEQILDFHAEGEDLFEAIVRGTAKLK